MRDVSSRRSPTRGGFLQRSGVHCCNPRSRCGVGPALAEFAFDDFAQAEIRRLEELRLVVIGERIDAELELGLHGDVIGELEGLAG